MYKKGNSQVSFSTITNNKGCTNWNKFISLSYNKNKKNLNIYLKPKYAPEMKIQDNNIASQMFETNKSRYFSLSPHEIKDFLQLIEKYSRSYYTKIPLIGSKLGEWKNSYKNPELKEDTRLIMQRVINEMPKKSFKLQTLFESFEYPRKLQFPKLVIEFSKTIAESQNQHIDPLLEKKVRDLAYVLENINIGLFLHNTLDNLEEIQKIAKGMFQKQLISKLTDKKLILIGDFYHVKASLESSKIGLIEIPMYMSTIEEETSKAICLKDELKKRIKDHSDKDLYELIKIDDIYDLAYHQTATVIAYSFLATSLLHFDSSNQEILDESFKIGFELGLALHFQRAVHQFVAMWPATTGQLMLKPQDLYSTGFSLPNYAMVQCFKNKTNLQEVNPNVLKFCDMHIENLKQQAKDRVERMGGDFSRLEKLFESFLKQI